MPIFAKVIITCLRCYFSLSVLSQIRKGFSDSIYEVVETIASVVDFEESKFQGRLCIKQGINDELDELRTNYENLDDILVRA